MAYRPQGGIDKGEDPYPAALREIYEETGMRSVSLLAEAPDWINYDLPPHLLGIALKGKYRGQTQKWFAFRFEGDESEIAIVRRVGGQRRLEFPIGTVKADSAGWISHPRVAPDGGRGGGGTNRG